VRAAGARRALVPRCDPVDRDVLDRDVLDRDVLDRDVLDRDVLDRDVLDRVAVAREPDVRPVAASARRTSGTMRRVGRSGGLRRLMAPPR
jgi:hypothetical protein